jgi:hypothetical protein
MRALFSLMLAAACVAVPLAQMDEMLKLYDPDLLKRAEAKGIYQRADYPVLRRMNPYFLRGDFNGDGAMDVAVWVTQRSSGLTGVAVIHSTLDTVHYIGAGNDRVKDKLAGFDPGVLIADTWHVLPAGTIEQAFSTVPEIGAVKDQKFTMQRETLQFVWLGKSSYVYYWANGRYWHLWTGD